MQVLFLQEPKHRYYGGGHPPIRLQAIELLKDAKKSWFWCLSYDV